jgi:hypothetical protein
MRRYEATSDGTPEGDKAAELANRLLDSIPEEKWRRSERATAEWAAFPMIYGVPHPESLETVIRRAWNS